MDLFLSSVMFSVKKVSFPAKTAVLSRWNHVQNVDGNTLAKKALHNIVKEGNY